MIIRQYTLVLSLFFFALQIGCGPDSAAPGETQTESALASVTTCGNKFDTAAITRAWTAARMDNVATTNIITRKVDGNEGITVTPTATLYTSWNCQVNSRPGWMAELTNAVPNINTSVKPGLTLLSLANDLITQNNHIQTAVTQIASITLDWNTQPAGTSGFSSLTPANLFEFKSVKTQVETITNRATLLRDKINILTNLTPGTQAEFGEKNRQTGFYTNLLATVKRYEADLGALGTYCNTKPAGACG